MILRKVRNFLSEDLSIDLGTVNCLISGRSKILLNEPTMVAQSIVGNTKKVIAVGLEARPMLGRTPGTIQIIQPLKDGVIADLDATVAMLQYFIHKVNKQYGFLKFSPRILVCVPCGATPVERRLIRDSVLQAGAREGYLIDEPMAAAIGAGMPIEEPGGSMVVDIGGGTTEIAVISLQGIVRAQSVQVGGNRFDRVIAQYIRNQYGILIGEASIEKIKHEIGTAFGTEEILEKETYGLHVAEGIPKAVKLSGTEILKVLEEPLSEIMQGILSVLRETPPELAGDIADRGIMMTGGGALLRNIDRLIQLKTGIKITIAEDPLTCVARGGGQALSLIGKLGYANFLMKE